ncbi:hypothetical protein F5876DRAFT_80597 [Lentinula aff. lateritia]|uniref:Uncharacterized protein n=1 Tax=Lentinula aff. lateritia TaxID=2804960 RepID=A0ACC1TP71_9AGAR|nr:hypothetical protein F5876DRAFT_80597 [Lentinula aff. lateritia]
MAHSLTFHSNIATAEDFVNVQDVEIELLDMTNASHNGSLDSSDTGSTGSGDESSLEFSDLEDPESEEPQVVEAVSHSWRPSDLADSESDEDQIVAETISQSSHPFLSPQSVSFPLPLSSPAEGSYSELYDSGHDELDEEPTELETSVHVLDAERQRHCAAITELEDRHAKYMIEHALEVQELRNVQAAMKEENCVQSAREIVLLQENEELQAQLKAMSNYNAAISREKEHLSLQILDALKRIADVERDYAEILASRESFAAKLVDRDCEMKKAKDEFAQGVQSLETARGIAITEGTRLRHELKGLTATTAVKHADLLSTHNALQIKLDNSLHELDTERMRFADEIHALTESRDSLRGDVERIRHEREALSNDSGRTISALRVKLQAEARERQAEHDQAISVAARALEEFRALEHAKDSTQAECQKLKGTISSLEATVYDNGKQYIAMQRSLETSGKSFAEEISILQKERDTLKLNVGISKQQLVKAQTDALQNTREAEKKLEILRSEKDEILQSTNREVKTWKRVVQARVDTIQTERNELSRRAEASDVKVNSLSSEKANLERELENCRVRHSAFPHLQSRSAVLEKKLLAERQAKEEAQKNFREERGNV